MNKSKMFPDSSDSSTRNEVEPNARRLALIANVEEIEKKSINEKTRKNYERRLGHLLAWLKANERSCERLERDGLADFLIGERCVIPVMLFLADRYMGEEGEEGGEGGEGERKGVGVGSLSQDFSAIGFCTKEKQREPNENLVKRFRIYLRGCAKDVAAKKQQGELKVEVGKAPVSFTNYKSICRSLCEKGELGSWLTLLLSWHLMNRINETTSISLDHIKGGGEDHILFIIPRQKNDQAGSRRKELRVYSHHEDPFLCPFVALGLYLLAGLSGETKLFGGKCESERSGFTRVLQHQLNLVKGKCATEDEDDQQEEEEERGKKRKRSVNAHGSHSIRKGAATFGGCGSTHTPSTLVICNRGGWSHGVIDRYVKQSESGDSYLGRCLRGVHRHSPGFATLPPHFASHDLTCVDDVVKSTFARSVCDKVGYPVLRLLLASLIHHKPKLLEVRPQFGTLLSCWDNNSADLPHVIVDVKSEFLTGTGIPPDVHHSIALAELHKESMEKMERVQQMLHAVPGLVKDSMTTYLDAFSAACGKVTPEFVMKQMDLRLKGLEEKLCQAVGVARPEGAAEDVAPSDPRPVGVGMGSLRSPLPPSFTLNADLLLPVLLWSWHHESDWKGVSATHKIPALRLLGGKDFSGLPNPFRERQRKLLCDMRFVVRQVLKRIEENDAGFSEALKNGSLTYTRVLEACQQVNIPKVPSKDAETEYQDNQAKLGVRALTKRLRWAKKHGL